MATSLRLIASSLVTRSPFLPMAVSASRFLSIDAGHRSYSTMPKDDFSVQSSLTIMCPKISSMRFKMRMTGTERTLKLQIPDDALTVELQEAGLNMKDMRPCAEQNTLFIQGMKQSLDKTSSDIKEEMEDGKLKVNEDEFKTNTILNNMANDIIASFHDIGVKRGWSYYDMFSDRSILGEGLCRVIAKSSPINSFSLYKREDDHRLEIEMSIPGKEGMMLTTQGLRVGLGMRGLGREDVKTYFEYNTFFIEGKTKNEHHITCIHLPEGVHIKHNMIKREVAHENFYAFLPCCGKMEELHDQLKIIKERAPIDLYF